MSSLTLLWEPFSNICVCAYVKTYLEYDSNQNLPLVLGIERYSDPSSLFTATSTYLRYYPACAARAKVIGVGVHIYVCGQKNSCNRTLAIESSFQIFTVGLLIKFID